MLRREPLEEDILAHLHSLLQEKVVTSSYNLCHKTFLVTEISHLHRQLSNMCLWTVVIYVATTITSSIPSKKKRNHESNMLSQRTHSIQYMHKAYLSYEFARIKFMQSSIVDMHISLQELQRQIQLEQEELARIIK
jgi:hypothetical protein